ncbi:MAG: hypothetical protein LBC18_12835 [Opitutaceae bacterium]|jgi:hypothetical protein|nr:hypothetical protein [Opitutaceae bacterium]
MKSSNHPSLPGNQGRRSFILKLLAGLVVAGLAAKGLRARAPSTPDARDHADESDNVEIDWLDDLSDPGWPC